MHVREQVAQAIVARLTGLATTGANVFRRRPEEEPLTATEMPGLCIWTESEQASAEKIGVPMYERPTQVRVEAKIRKTGEVETTLNQIGAEVETALGPAIQLPSGGQELFAFYLASTFQDSADGDQTVAVLTMRFQVAPLTNHGAPEIAI